MSAGRDPSLVSIGVEVEDGSEDEGPFMAWLPPDDRLWRHPSEVGDEVGGAVGDARRRASKVATVAAETAPWAAGRTWTVAVVAGIVGALAASGVGMVSGAFEQQTTVVGSVNPAAPSLSLAADTGSAGTVVDWTSVDDSIAPSVVNIDVSSASGPMIGSGLLMFGGGNSSYVITDSTLVAGATSITLSYLSGQTARAKLVASDPMTGLALVSVSNAQGIFPVLGTVADLRDANPVLAIGARTSPGGSVFEGSISGQDRSIEVTDGAVMQNMIAATTTQIPSSSTGGPLVDSHGRVVGVTVALDPTDPTDQGLTFAVPIDLVERVCRQMIASVTVDHPWLGITNAADLSSVVARQYGLSGGAQVGNIWPGGPASKAGLSPSDIVTAFDGVPVTSIGSLTRLLSQVSPGTAAPISFLHDGSPHKGVVVVSNQPDGD